MPLLKLSTSRPFRPTFLSKICWIVITVQCEFLFGPSALSKINAVSGTTIFIAATKFNSPICAVKPGSTMIRPMQSALILVSPLLVSTMLMSLTGLEP